MNHTPKTKIIIIGIGGVGGYFGGLLAKHFETSETVEICFIARGKHLEQIQRHGLKVIKGSEEFIARPSQTTDKFDLAGKADYIILCTKSYDLESMLEKLHLCTNEETVILPLLNGVDSFDLIKQKFPDNLVLHGCVYIVSRLKEAGVIENTGNVERLFFGLHQSSDKKTTYLETLFHQAGIDATLSPNILSIVWEKFIFIAPTASATSYYDTCIGNLLNDEEKNLTLKTLIKETVQLANAKQIAIQEDIIEKTLNKLKSLPFETTSSMHSDFVNHKEKTELESLTGYVVRESKVHNLEAPMFSKIYEALKK